MQRLTLPVIREKERHPLLIDYHRAIRDRLLAIPGVVGIELPYLTGHDDCSALAGPRLLIHDEEGHYTRNASPSAELVDLGMPDEWRGQAALDLLELSASCQLELWMQSVGPLRGAPPGLHFLLTLMDGLSIVGENGFDDAVHEHADALHEKGQDAKELRRVATLVLPTATSHHQAIGIVSKARRSFETWRALYAPTLDVIAEAHGLAFDPPDEGEMGKLFSA